MSEETREDVQPGSNEEALERDDEGAGIGFDKEPNTFEPEEDPEATGDPS